MEYLNKATVGRYHLYIRRSENTSFVLIFNGNYNSPEVHDLSLRDVDVRRQQYLHDYNALQRILLSDSDT